MDEDHFSEVVCDFVKVGDWLDVEGCHTHLFVERLDVADHLYVHPLLTDTALLLIDRVLILCDPFLNFDPRSSPVVDFVHQGGGTFVDLHDLTDQTHLEQK